MIGCSSGSEMTSAQVDAIKHPDMKMSPDAQAAMSKQAELQKKQLDANAAAGVDSRGVPLAKSTLGGAATPGTSGVGK